MMKLSDRAGARFLAAVTILAVAAAIGAGCSDPGPSEVSEVIYTNRVVVAEAATPPPLDDPRAEAWDSIPIYGITVGDPDSGYTDDMGKWRIFLQAIKADNNLYIRAEWVDVSFDSLPGFLIFSQDTLPVESGDTLFDTIQILPLEIDTIVLYDTLVNRYWSQADRFSAEHIIDTIYDTIDAGGPVVDTIYDTTLSFNNAYDQDRFAIIWDAGDNGGEKADCKSLCHAVGDTSTLGHRMYTTGGGHVDVWVWRSATTNPLELASDQYWSSEGRETDAVTVPMTTLNYDTDTKVPLLTHTTTVDYSRSILFSDETVPYDSTLAWVRGHILAGQVLNRDAAGSLADVAAYADFSSRLRWALVMRRALTTGNADDIDFASVASGDSVMATVAIMDNADRLHSGSTPIYFIFP